MAGKPDVSSTPGGKPDVSSTPGGKPDVSSTPAGEVSSTPAGRADAPRTAAGRAEQREPLGPGAARMLYNLADALHPELARDLVPAAAKALRHRGPAAVRRMHFWLFLLEWEPLLGHARRRFWRLPREQRQAACQRFRSSRFVWRRRAWAELSAWAEDALADSPGVSAPEGRI